MPRVTQLSMITSMLTCSNHVSPRVKEHAGTARDPPHGALQVSTWSPGAPPWVCARGGVQDGDLQGPRTVLKAATRWRREPAPGRALRRGGRRPRPGPQAPGVGSLSKREAGALGGLAASGVRPQ